MLISRKNIKIILTTFLFVSLCQFASAQLKIIPIARQPVSERGIERSNHAARTQEASPLQLPFFDDFSKPAFEIYADTSKWTESYGVWVNDGMAVRSPTINVATFDALDSAGRAYNTNEVLATGYADQLTSRPIDLSEHVLPAAEQPSVYLSFFYQWQGNVEAPDEKDFLELQFRTAEEGAWETVLTIFAEEDTSPTDFYDTILQVSGGTVLSRPVSIPVQKLRPIVGAV